MRLACFAAFALPVVLGCAGVLSPPEGTNPGECEDDVDNDADGLMDCEDSDCDGETFCLNAEVDDTGGGGGDDTGDGGNDPVFTETWGSSALEIKVKNGTVPYDFGLAEDASTADDPWTGEDCMDGYELGSGDVLLYCHVGTSKGITLAYNTGDPQVLENDETLFPGPEYDGRVTFIALADDDTGDCWVWGADPSYYDKLGCTEQ